MDVENPCLDIDTFKSFSLDEKYTKILNSIKKTIKPNSNIEDIISYFNMNLITTDRYCDGYFDYDNKLIAISKDTNINRNDFKNTLSHELSHLIQTYTDDFRDLCETNLLSDMFRLEQHCEKIAGDLHTILFNEKYKYSYNTVGGLIFLNDWYGNRKIENDLLFI